MAHLEKITDPGDLAAELDRLRTHYNTIRLHASIGYVTPRTNTKAAATPSVSAVATGSNEPAKDASTTVEDEQDNNHEHATPMVGYLSDDVPH